MQEQDRYVAGPWESGHVHAPAVEVEDVVVTKSRALWLSEPPLPLRNEPFHRRCRDTARPAIGGGQHRPSRLTQTTTECLHTRTPAGEGAHEKLVACCHIAHVRKLTGACQKESIVTNVDVDAALHAIFDANRLLRDASERISARTGQTHSRRMVLQAAGDRATVPDIARKLGLQRQSVQRVADELVRDGLARYEENPRHRRSPLLATTAAGKTTLATIQSAHRAWVEEIEAAAGELDWARLRGDLGRIARTVDGLHQAPG